MKQEKTMPRGVEPVSRTGVHRNTKMYMQLSSRDYKKRYIKGQSTMQVTYKILDCYNQSVEVDAQMYGSF